MVNIGSVCFSAEAENTMMAQAIAYNETDNATDTEYMLAVQGLKRLCNTSILTDHERDVLRLRYRQGMNCKDIADMLGVAPSTISHCINLAQSRIQEIYAAVFPRFADASNISGKKSRLTIDRLSTGARA